MKIAEKVRSGFPLGIEFPEALLQLCSWLESNGYPISGRFELCENGKEYISTWIAEEEIRKRFAVFGTSANKSLYCVWLQDNGQTTIAYIGTGGVTKIFASNMKEFVRLLAIGYEDLCRDDLSRVPESRDFVNKDFQNWVVQTFHTTIPSIGQDIADAVTHESDDLGRWLVANCKWDW